MAGGLALGYLVFAKVDGLSVDILDPINLGVISAGLILGSLIPDLDHKNSYISNKAKSLSFFTSRLFKHRGFTHSILGTLIFYYILNYFLPKLSLYIDIFYLDIFKWALIIGFISHIILDMMTPGGVVLFYPIIDKRIRLVNIKKDKNKYKILDKMVFLVSIFIIGAIYVYREILQ